MDEKEKIIDKINKLIALANNNPDRNEARSARAKAYKLMNDYDIDENLFTNPTGYSSAAQEQTTYTTTANPVNENQEQFTNQNTYQDYTNTTFEQQTQNANYQQQQNSFTSSNTNAAASAVGDKFLYFGIIIVISYFLYILIWPWSFKAFVLTLGAMFALANLGRIISIAIAVGLFYGIGQLIENAVK